MDRALIIGCGYVGQYLARALRAANVSVAGTRAAGDPTARAPGGEGDPLPLRPVDLRAPGPLELPEAREAVVFYLVPTLARRYEGLPHRPPFARCLAALERERVRGLVYLSSTSVYGDRGDEWVDEQTPVSPGSPWGRMRVDLEQDTWTFGARTGCPACVVRAPEIYGPGRGPLARLRQGYALRFPRRFTNRIHVEDLVQVLVELGRRLQPGLLLAADDEPAPAIDVYRFAAAQLGLPPPPLLDEASGDANRQALQRESKRCRNAALLAWLGRPLRYPSYREGLAARESTQGSPPRG